MGEKIPSEKRFSSCLKNNPGASRTPESQQTTKNASYVTFLPATIVSTTEVTLFDWNKRTLHGSSHSHRMAGIIAEWQPHHLMISTTSQELESNGRIYKNIATVQHAENPGHFL